MVDMVFNISRFLQSSNLIKIKTSISHVNAVHFLCFISSTYEQFQNLVRNHYICKLRKYLCSLGYATRGVKIFKLSNKDKEFPKQYKQHHQNFKNIVRQSL